MKHDIGAEHPDRGLSEELGYDRETAQMTEGQMDIEASLECFEQAYMQEVAE